VGGDVLIDFALNNGFRFAIDTGTLERKFLMPILPNTLPNNN
jgi:hypothetical protein